MKNNTYKNIYKTLSRNDRLDKEHKYWLFIHQIINKKSFSNSTFKALDFLNFKKLCHQKGLDYMSQLYRDKRVNLNSYSKPNTLYDNNGNKTYYDETDNKYYQYNPKQELPF